MIFSSGEMVKDTLSEPEGDNLIEWSAYAFEKSVYGSGVINAFFYSTSVICVLFMIFKIVENFKDVTLGKRFDLWKNIMPLVLTFVIGVWKYLYEGLDSGFDYMENMFFNYLANKSTGSPNLEFMEMMLKDLMSSSVAILYASAQTIFITLLGTLVASLNYIFDVGVTLYVEVNVMLLAILSPVALLFSYMNGMQSLVMWTKIFFKYKILALFPTMLTYIGISFLQTLHGRVGDMSGLQDLGETVSGVSLVITVFSFTTFFVLKIIFLLSGYKLLDSLLQTQGGSIGSAIGGMVGTGLKGAKLATGNSM